MIGSKQAARLRHKKKHGKISAKDVLALDAYERAKASGDLRGMRLALAPEPAPVGDPAAADPAAPPAADPAPAPDVVTPPPVDAPPPVDMTARADHASSSGRWQDKYRTPAHGLDGREMACVFIGDQWVSLLQALEDDLALIGKKPVIAAAQMRNIIIIALDQLLPDKVKLTPPIAAAVGTTTIAIQRIRHHKAIVEVQKADPRIEDYKREVAAKAERERAEKIAAEQAAKQAANTNAAKPAEPEVKHATPPPAEPTPAPMVSKPAPIDPAPTSIAAPDGNLYA